MWSRFRTSWCFADKYLEFNHNPKADCKYYVFPYDRNNLMLQMLKTVVLDYNHNITILYWCHVGRNLKL